MKNHLSTKPAYADPCEVWITRGRYGSADCQLFTVPVVEGLPYIPPPLLTPPPGDGGWAGWSTMDKRFQIQGCAEPPGRYIIRLWDARGNVTYKLLDYMENLEEDMDYDDCELVDWRKLKLWQKEGRSLEWIFEELKY